MSVNDFWKDIDTEEKLRQLKVASNSRRSLRRFVNDNKIFKGGLDRMKKEPLIQKIIKSQWWKDNIIDKPKTPPIEEKKTEIDDLDDVSQAQQEVNEVIAMANEILKPSLNLTKHYKKTTGKDKISVLKHELELCRRELQKKEEEILKRGEEIVQLSDTKPEKKKAIKQLKADIVETQPDNIENNLDDIMELLTKQTTTIKNLVNDKPPATPYPTPVLNPTTQNIDTLNVKTLNIDGQPFTDGLITHKDSSRQQVDTGHSIVNVYCNGSNHPDFPIPQSVVRQALNSQQLPLFQQQQLGEVLRQEAAQQPIIQGIPPQAIPEAVPHPSHSNIPQAPPPPPPPPVQPIQPRPAIRKFPPVKPPDTKRKEQVAPPITQPTAPPASNFDDDEEEEETEAERARRERREQMALETGSSRKKGFNENFKKKLEGLLARKP